MPEVTGGVVRFERTVKVTDFEPKKAVVELTFSTLEGEAWNQPFFDDVARKAQNKVHDMLEIKRPVIQITHEPDVLAGAAAGAKPTQVREPRKTAKATAPAAATPAAPAAISTGEERVDPAADWLPDEAAVPEITDEDLTKEIGARNAILKNPVLIRQTIAKYAGPAPKNHRHIPQAVRQQFLDDLDAAVSAVKATG